MKTRAQSGTSSPAGQSDSLAKGSSSSNGDFGESGSFTTSGLEGSSHGSPYYVHSGSGILGVSPLTTQINLSSYESNENSAQTTSDPTKHCEKVMKTQTVTTGIVQDEATEKGIKQASSEKKKEATQKGTDKALSDATDTVTCINKALSDTSQFSVNFVSLIGLCATVVVIIACLLGLLLSYGKATSVPLDCSIGRQGAACRFVNELDKLKHSYDKQLQNKKLWKVINATVKAVLYDESPLKPAILVLTSNDGNLLDEFGRDLAATVAASYDPSLRGYYTNLNRHISASYNDDELKENYDDTIVKDVQEQQYNVVIVPRAELLTGKVALLWHGYCDHENAQFKDIVIVFTVALSSNQAVTDNNVDTTVEKFLETKWSQGLGGIDNFGALWSRIGGSVAIVK